MNMQDYCPLLYSFVSFIAWVGLCHYHHSRTTEQFRPSPLTLLSSLHPHQLHWASSFFFNFFFFFLTFWLCSGACGILVPWPGIKPVPPAVEVQSLNHWTTREALGFLFIVRYSLPPPLAPVTPWSVSLSLSFCLFKINWNHTISGPLSLASFT